MKTNLTSTTSHSCNAADHFTPAMHESAYAFLVRSEDRSGLLMEALAYLLCVICALVSLGHFVRQPVVTPAMIKANSAARVAFAASATLADS